MSPIARPYKRALGFFVVCLTCYLFFYVALISNSSHSSLEDSRDIPHGGRVARHETVSPTVPPKKILIFAATHFFNMAVTTERFLSECTSTKAWCSLSENGSDFTKADGVLIHNADYPNFNNKAIFTERRTDIPYVLWSLESPTNDYFRPGANQINWTMTFRRDADIFYPYGHMIKRETPITVDIEAIWGMKDQSLPVSTWLASNCFARNGRTQLVDRLQKAGLTVDRWGGCGKPPPDCSGVNKQGWDCVVQLIKPYKFYLGFENSQCKDYVTEKFYETLRSRMAVPLVTQRKNYEALGVPSSSFVAMDDFKSVDDMAKHVMAVASNKTAYLEYHKWREEYEVIPEHHDSTGFCELCRRLQARVHMTNEERLDSAKSYENVNSWHNKGMCQPTFLNDYMQKT